jgi:hypothetical protein
MTSEIRELQMPNGRPIFVEVEISDKEISLTPSERPKDLPAGAEAVGIIDDALNSMKLFQENITNMAETVYDRLILQLLGVIFSIAGTNLLWHK